ncbi:MAG: hypothetical protein M1830_000163 [Pleopsidium flavum]|nr:MAG: hypothetical protein M1830_000163 [Pleopsidium flavum]
MTARVASHGEGTTILPIPPALEFPYPDGYAHSSIVPSEAASAAPSSILQDSPITHGVSKSHTAPAMSRSMDQASRAQQRPSLGTKEFMTERPVPGRRRTFLGTNRRGKEINSATPNTAAWNSDLDSLDSSSSSEDENFPAMTRIRSKTSGRSTTTAQDKSTGRAGQRERSEGRFSKFSVGNDQYETKGKVSKRDGRLNISVNETANSGYLAKALGATLHRHLGSGKKNGDEDAQPLSPLHEDNDQVRPGVSRVGTASTLAASINETIPRPKLNIVIMVIGSRGDIQPFLKIGKLLKEQHGHRVRIATHPAFKEFVERDSGLEFFSVGGDPAELMAFMVKNPGLVPSVSAVRAGEIGKRRETMFEMFQGFWRACINATDDEKDKENVKMMGDKHPFVADAIIANPPSFAHVHCAERLGVPLHLMFTFPYTPTQQFPHPLANIKATNVDTNYTNFMSYPLVEMMTWQGLGDLVNRFRVKSLGLEPVSTLWAPGQLFRLKVPYTYLWSPGLVPKPADWGPEIDIAGFVFLELASSFKPPDSLVKFLEAGEQPLYIGFGSIVVDDPDRFTSLIFEAVKKAGVRALVSKGWGGLGDEGNTPENIYMLENTPHDWLFPRVSAVVHHGGAGTTAIGLKLGKPTMIVPFFGDQPFWGAMVAKAGAGAHDPTPYKRLTADKLAEGIKQCLSPEAKEAAEKIAKGIAEEGDGAENAVKSFHRSLPLRGEHSLRCSILEERVAVWLLKKTIIRLSALAANILVEQKKIRWQDLRLIRFYEWNDFEGPGEPITGGGAALLTAVGGVVHGVGGTPVRWARRIKRKEDLERRKKEQQRNTDMGGKSDGHNGSGKHLPNGTVTNGSVHGEAMRNSLQHKTNAPRPGTKHHRDSDEADARSTMSDGSEENLAEDFAADAGAGLAMTGEALAKAPMNLSLAIAQGFHNAPRLYGDDTVRRPIRISGFHSGLKAAGEEFVYGIYDGWTGLVLHPYKGAKQGGGLGFVKGVGKGVGGFVLKDLAAIIGPFGYTLKGIHKELQKGRQPTHYIRMARTIQGRKDLRLMNEEERNKAIEAVARGWRIILDIRSADGQKKAKGLRGRIEMHKEHKYWREHGAFENVEQANKALEAQKKGHSFDKVFKRQRKELRMAEAPRKSTMTKAQRQGKAWMEKEEKERKERERVEMADGNTGTVVTDQAMPQVNGERNTNGLSHVDGVTNRRQLN